MNRTPTSLLRDGQGCARLGSPLASATQQEKIARSLLAGASFVQIVEVNESSSERRRANYSDVTSIPRALICGHERRAIFAFYRTLDWEWFAKAARRLYLPAVVRNPRTMFSNSRSAFDASRKQVAADHLDLAIQFGETNPLVFAIFISSSKSAQKVYRALSLHAKVPKKWAMSGGLPQM